MPLHYPTAVKRVATKRLSIECGGKLRVIAAIEDPPLITKIIGHVQRREALTSTPRGPPDSKEALHLTWPSWAVDPEQRSTSNRE